MGIVALSVGKNGCNNSFKRSTSNEEDFWIFFNMTVRLSVTIVEMNLKKPRKALLF